MVLCHITSLNPYVLMCHFAFLSCIAYPVMKSARGDAET